MATKVTVLVIYLIGVVISYRTMRMVWLRDFKEWTIADRKINMVASLCSWATVIIWILLSEMHNLDKRNNKPAKW